MRWLNAHGSGVSIPSVIQSGIAEMARQEQMNSQATDALG